MKNNYNSNKILIYTDGSCHTQKRIGAWVAILLYGKQEIILQGNEKNTTHNRMELVAVIKAIEYVTNNLSSDIEIQVFTDSQYVMRLPARSDKLMGENFITKKGKDLHNQDLLKILFALFASRVIHLNKVTAHQKKDNRINYNIVADELARRMIREWA